MYSASYIIKAIDQFSPVASKIKNSFQQLTGKIDSSTKSVSRMSTVFSKLTYLRTLATGLGAYKVGNVLYRFSEQMQGVKSVAKETDVTFAQLEKQAKLLGRTTRYTASEAASGMYFLAKAGYDTKKIYDVIPSVLLLASAANLDLARAADIMTNIMASQQFEAKDSVMVTDVLSKAFSSANTDLVQLGEAMKYAGSVSKGLGTSFTEATAALAIMGDTGIQSSMAGTALRGALSRLVSTNSVIRMVKKLNLEFYDAKGNLKSIADIIEEIEKKKVKTPALMKIFGLRAGPAMLNLVSQGSERLRTFTQTLEDSQGFAQRAADIRMEGLFGSWKKMISALEGLVHTLGDLGLTQLLSDVAVGIANLSNWLSDAAIEGTKFKKVADFIGTAMGNIAFYGGKIIGIAWDSLIQTGEKIGEAFAWPVIQLQKLWDLIQNVLGSIKRFPDKLLVRWGLKDDPLTELKKNNIPLDGSDIWPLDVNTNKLPEYTFNNQSQQPNIYKDPFDIKNKIEIDLKINDKNNTIGSIEAKTLSPRSNLSLNVGRSGAGE